MSRIRPSSATSRRSQAPILPNSAAPDKELIQIKQTLNFYRRLMQVLGGLLILIAIGYGTVLMNHYLLSHRTSPNPVPMAVRQSVNFTVYYPDQSKLPAGYTLDTQSFTASSLAVVYAIRYGSNHKLVFSVQQKPKTTDIQAFYSNHLPLRTNLNTPVGTAAIGAIGSQTLVSLPTKGNAWLLITGPSSVNQSQLKQVLQSIKG